MAEGKQNAPPLWRIGLALLELGPLLLVYHKWVLPLWPHVLASLRVLNYQERVLTDLNLDFIAPL
jgi:hypothetical protein